VAAPNRRKFGCLANSLYKSVGTGIVNSNFRSWLAENIVCPRHRTSLRQGDATLVCLEGCRYPLLDDVPVMLLDDERQTMDLCQRSLQQARKGTDEEDLYLDSIGLSDQERQGIKELAGKVWTIDPAVAYLISATNGIAYKHLIGNLRRYPVPDLRLPLSQGKVFLDIGCNWGRWCMAAAQLGYRPVGIDPSLGAVMSARRVARQMGLEAAFVVGDARFLPFRAGSIDQAFSYSVLQHLSRNDAALAVGEIGRVLKTDGASLIQMPTKFGVRCLYHQARRKFREGLDFEVRYWTLSALRTLFASKIGTSTISVDCFFGIGLQRADLDLMKPLMRIAIRLSEALRSVSQVISPLVWVADSVYVTSRKAAESSN
jgi:SAM-dependent methyltransferase